MNRFTNSHKQSGLYLILLLITFHLDLANATSILDYSAGTKKYADTHPKFAQAAIAKTDLNAWARCTAVYVATTAMEVRGQTWDDDTAVMFAIVGEAMSRVRANFLAKGYTDDALSKLLKTYTSRQVDVPDMKFCNILENDIMSVDHSK